MPAVAARVAALPEVTFVDLDRSRELLDLHAASVLQASELITQGFPAPDLGAGTGTNGSATSQHFPLWKAGVQGNGQVRCLLVAGRMQLG